MIPTNRQEDPDEIFAATEITPEFNGNFQQFLDSNLQYLTAAKNSGLEAVVTIFLLVEKDGSCQAIKLHDNSPSKNPDFVKEATRLISLIGKKNYGVLQFKMVKTFVHFIHTELNLNYQISLLTKHRILKILTNL